MTGEIALDLTVRVRDDDSEQTRTVTIRARPAGRVSELVEVVKSAQQVSPNLFVWDGRAHLDPNALVKNAQLHQFQGLLVLDELTLDKPMAPKLSEDDQFRVVHTSGLQYGFAWPLSNSVLRIYRDPAGYWLPAGPGIEPDLTLNVDPSNENAVQATAGTREFSWLLGDTTFQTLSVASGAVMRVLDVDGEEIASFQVLKTSEHEATRNGFGRLPLRVRPRRVPYSDAADGSFELESFPSTETPEWDIREILMGSLQPAMMALVMTLAVGFRWYYILLALSWPLVSFVIHRWRFEKQQTRFLREVDHWYRAVNERAGECLASAEQEGLIIKARNPPLDVLIPAATDRNGPVWERRVSHGDFLRVSLGLGIYVSGGRVRVTRLPPGDEEIWSEHLHKVRQAANIPIEFDLRRSHLGVVGGPAAMAEYASYLLAQVLLLHSPASLAVVLMLPVHRGPELGWLEVVPHLRVPSQQWVGARALYGAVAGREALLANLQVDDPDDSGHLLIVAHEGAGVDVSLLESFVSKRRNVHVLWLATSWGTLPGLIPSWVELRGSICQLLPGPSGSALGVAPAYLGQHGASAVGIALAPLIDDSGATSTSSGIPVEVSLATVLDANGPLFDRSSAKTLQAEFLVSQHGVYSLDFEAEGPHILVGGMSGSGKSEFLRSMICSLVTHYSRSELALLLVDFKGGSTLSHFSSVPQCIGLVSNLSLIDVDRLISFLRQELLRRQRALRAFGGEYRAYRESVLTATAIPRLVVVIDEFASFIEGPQARMEAIQEISQKGRSLGVHLVFATQSPQTTARTIRDNVGARFCLRTSDSSGSDAILGKSVAAHIPGAQRGRLFALLTDGNIAEFQSAYSKSKSIEAQAAAGQVSLLRPDLPVDGSVEDWELVVSRVLEAEDSSGRNQPRFLPALSEVDDDRFIAEPTSWADGVVDGPYIGIADLPGEQTQRIERVSWNRLSLLVSGVAGSGRTSILRVMLHQFGTAHPSGHCVVIDPTTDSSTTWSRVLDGPGCWFATQKETDAVGQLVEQVESLLVAPREGQRAMIALERLDQVAALMSEDLVSRLAMLIANGPRNGIFFVATCDARSALPKLLKMAFLNTYRFREDAPFHLESEQDGHLLRALTGNTAWTAVAVAGSNLPIGHVTLEALARVALQEEGVNILVGMDDFRHSPVTISQFDDLVVFGGSPVARLRTITELSLELQRAGRRLGFVAGDPSLIPSGAIDVLAEVLKHSGETADERFEGAIEDASLDHLIFIEVQQLQRHTSRRLSGLGNLSLLVDKIKSAQSEKDLVIWGTYQMAPFDNSDFGGRHNLQAANYLYLDPKPAVLLGGYFHAAKSFVAARPGRIYRIGEAVGFIDGERADIAHLIGNRSHSQEQQLYVID